MSGSTIWLRTNKGCTYIICMCRHDIHEKLQEETAIQMAISQKLAVFFQVSSVLCFGFSSKFVFVGYPTSTLVTATRSWWWQ